MKMDRFIELLKSLLKNGAKENVNSINWKTRIYWLISGCIIAVFIFCIGSLYQDQNFGAGLAFILIFPLHILIMMRLVWAIISDKYERKLFGETTNSYFLLLHISFRTTLGLIHISWFLTTIIIMLFLDIFGTMEF